MLSLTAVMGYIGSKVELDYNLAQLLPKDDPTYVAHQEFKKQFGQEGNILVIGCEKEDLFELENFNKWYEFGNELQQLKAKRTIKVNGKTKEVEVRAVDSAFSIAHLYNLQKDTINKKFVLSPIVSSKPKTQQEVDSIKRVVYSLPFYKNVIYQEDSDLHIIMVFMNQDLFNSKDRGNIIHDIETIAKKYEVYFPDLKYSGLPYIRSVNMQRVRSELGMFVGLAMLVTSLLLIFFFKSFRVMLVSMIVVAIGVTWSFGTIGLLGYKITILMGLIPPLIIVIGIPNCIYLINKYQQEFRLHKNKVKALTRVISKIGTATFMTNATTAMGFATFIFTRSDILKDFGVVSSINIMIVFLLSILVIPIIYSYMPEPNQRQTRHLDKKWVYWTADKLVLWTTSYRKSVYVITSAIVLVGVYGIFKMKTTGNIVDDLPQDDKVLLDLKYFEEEFNGVMPFELVIDTKVKNRVFQDQMLEKIETIQYELSKEKYLSKSISIVDAVKFLNQSYHGGDEQHYDLKNGSALRRINKYLQGSKSNITLGSSFIDTNFSKTRISIQVADIGTKEMEKLLSRIRPKIDSILNPSKNEITTFSSKLNNTLSASDVKTFFTNHPDIQKKFELAYFSDEEAQLNLLINPDLLYDMSNGEEYTSTLKSVLEKQMVDFYFTGTSVVFTSGTNYLTANLITSLIIAIAIIGVLMAFLFKSSQMVIASLIPNFIPLIVTAAIMGYAGIAIKPSTILVFSIAFGISVD
ncbi:MAG: efflux RND transporter permease subunit, partial [Bacteroidia bacterium]